MIKALLFDLDGTLVDSEIFHFECWNVILANYGLSLSHNDWLEHHAGVPMPNNAKTLIEKYNLPITHADLVKRRETLTNELLKTRDISLMPFVQEILEHGARKGLTLAVVTGSPRPDVDAILERKGLSRFFSTTVTRTDVINSKPHPESYELCLKILGLEKDECIVFEDTLNGIKSAKAAGLVCYAVQSNTREHHKLLGADKIFLNFAEVLKYLLDNQYIN